MTEGRRMNKHGDPIRQAWLNLFICITTDDVNAFYNALSGRPVRDSGHHVTWDEATLPYNEKLPREE